MINHVQGVQGVQACMCRVKTTPLLGCAGCAGLQALYVRVRAQCVNFNFKIKFIPCTPCTPCTGRVLSIFMIFLSCTLPYTYLLTLHKMKNNDEKRKQWELIQNHDPDLAKFLVKINEVFGKPAGLAVEFESGERIASGSLIDSFDGDSDK